MKNEGRFVIGDESGQSLFELIVFIPFLIYFFTLIINIGNSINVSINQQKSSRGYFHHLASGNANLPSREYLDSLSAGSISQVGMDFVGWRVEDENREPIAPCFKLGSLFGEDGAETCKNKDAALDPSKSNFIRIYTAYGICSASYRKNLTGFVHSEFQRGLGSCSRR